MNVVHCIVDYRHLQVHKHSKDKGEEVLAVASESDAHQVLVEVECQRPLHSIEKLRIGTQNQTHS